MAERVNAQIADAVTERLIQTQRVATGLRLDVWRRLAGLEADILALLKMSDPTEETLLRARRRAIEELMEADLDPLIRERYSALAALLTAALVRLARHEAGIIQGIVHEATGEATLPDLPSDAALRRVVTQSLIPTPQRPTDLSAVGEEWWQRQGQSLSQRVRDSLLVGVSLAESLTQLTARVRGTSDNGFADGIMAKARTDAATVVQTQVTNAVGEAHVAVARRNATPQLVIIHTSILDSHTSAICLARHGLRFTADTHEPIGHDIPYLGGVPYHPNCVVGSTRVLAAGIQGTSQREYVGEVVTIRTKRGYELTCTPNHPILTNQGWVAAYKLDVGSNLFCCSMQEGAISLVDMDCDNRPPCIQDIAQTLHESFCMASMPVPVAAEDFHGDGEGSKIAVIETDCLLRDGGGVQSKQPVMDLRFLRMHKSFGFQRLRFLEQRCLCDLSSSRGTVSSSSLPGTLLRQHLSPFLTLLFTLRADRDVVLNQASSNGLIARLVESTNRIKRQPISVCRDNVIYRQVQHFSGHVYNLQTESGWYVSNNIITHNCRSSFQPGVRTGGPIPDASVSQWLSRRDTAFQDEVLGPTRARMFRAGTLSPRQLLDAATGKPLTLEELGV